MKVSTATAMTHYSMHCNYLPVDLFYEFTTQFFTQAARIED
jgi:hypothetical protein